MLWRGKWSNVQCTAIGIFVFAMFLIDRNLVPLPCQLYRLVCSAVCVMQNWLCAICCTVCSAVCVAEVALCCYLLYSLQCCVCCRTGSEVKCLCSGNVILNLRPLAEFCYLIYNGMPYCNSSSTFRRNLPPAKRHQNPAATNCTSVRRLWCSWILTFWLSFCSETLSKLNVCSFSICLFCFQFGSEDVDRSFLRNVNNFYWTAWRLHFRLFTCAVSEICSNICRQMALGRLLQHPY
jgi:hypothetical protein